MHTPDAAATSRATPALAARPRSADAASAGLRLQCPRCRSGIDARVCTACGFAIVAQDGILRALPPQARDHFARFMDDYEWIRRCEGRGSESAAFYLALPYWDSTGRNGDQWRMRARSYDYLLRHLLPAIEPRRGGGILDLGAGNGWMSYRLALAGYRPCAVDLLTNDSDGLGAARHYQSRLPDLFPRFQADLGHLPFADGQFDAAVFNASFHYAEDATAALREALRCVRPGGAVIVSDTPWYARDESGRQMVAERHVAFRQRYGRPCDALATLDYLTDERLQHLAEATSVSWEIHHPWYGLRWAMRPLIAQLRGRREPSRFRLYVARNGALA